MRTADGPTQILVNFVDALRAAGLSIGIAQSEALLRATQFVDVAARDDLYWASRATLVSNKADLAAFDRTFASMFLEESTHGSSSQPPKVQRANPSQAAPTVLQRDDTETVDGEPTEIGAEASGLEVLRRKDFATCDDEELRAIDQLLRQLRLNPPTRRSRRSTAAPRGQQIDMRRTIRASMRHAGDTRELLLRDRATRMRPVVFMLDVSGSMRDYSRPLLQFSHVLARTSDRVEVFCFGTRLTRITDVARQRGTAKAVEDAAERVMDWDGGTMIGRAMTDLVREWSASAVIRGAVVLICSDGLERGDPDDLARSMARLRRLAHRVIWVTPLMRNAEYEPVQRGILAARPSIDDLRAGHNLASLQDLAAVLSSI